MVYFFCTNFKNFFKPFLVVTMTELYLSESHSVPLKPCMVKEFKAIHVKTDRPDRHKVS